ncbi:MAG: hypothetical protein DWQ54_16460 [Microcystis flos-aquae TF09]|jgi:hypothetical protein|uniref:Uncharacterized protein n=1 Tax=Microcystis flos-aquae TF09 TaxID=2060473 RepID=A0A3E0L183_9CHRO|nr:MAG: hypothetical protein DWQ54_16460 [Microcystis flos-aquae TF09]
MRPIKKWVEYPLVEVRGIYVEEGECRLLEGYVVQRYQEGGIFLFSEIADLMQYEVESAEQKLKNNVIDVAAQSIVGGIFGAMFGGRAGAEIGSHLGALGAASETIVEISLIQSGSHRLHLIVDPSAINLLESIFNGSFKRSATILSINSNLKQQQKDAQKAALGCLGIIGGVILLIVIIGLLLGASKSPQLDKSPQSEDQSSLNNQPID